MRANFQHTVVLALNRFASSSHHSFFDSTEHQFYVINWETYWKWASQIFHSVQIAYGCATWIQISEYAACSLLCSTVYNPDSSCSPVFEEASEPKGHKLQNSLQYKDSGEHVVAVLEGSLQRLWKEEKENINCIKLPGCSPIGYDLGGRILSKNILQLRVCTVDIIIAMNLLWKCTQNFGETCTTFYPRLRAGETCF